MIKIPDLHMIVRVVEIIINGILTRTSLNTSGLAIRKGRLRRRPEAKTFMASSDTGLSLRGTSFTQRVSYISR